MPPPTKPTSKNPPPQSQTEYQAIAAKFAAAKRAKAAQDAAKARTAGVAKAAGGEAIEKDRVSLADKQRTALEARRKSNFEARWLWTVGFWVWLLLIHVAGIAYFTSGFLLTRLMLDEKSVCDAPPTLNTSTNGVVDILPNWKGKGTVDGGCWHPKTFERAVVVVIDALRYDFTVPIKDDAPFHNAFPFMYDTALTSPNNAVLRPFIADPPTTTLQRLKGLTTGTLPTFVDVGSSFAGTAIEEDNLLMQLRDAGKRIVHLGDDTWESLFPGYFQANLSRAYDSFNVWDLHTVDNGVIEHIFPLMKRKGDWDVVVAHLLGVDHAGHRYGPDHPEMAKKLQQMNTFIKDLASNIDDDTLLIVMGDHGMDSKGDHGGESEDEVEAALWMYSPKPVFGRTKPEYVTPPATAKTRPANQIDLVPTLALLMGIPIPYNNLGHPIEEAFVGPRGTAWDRLAAAERMAAAGIKRYQTSYFSARGIEQATTPGSPADLWDKAEALVPKSKVKKGHSWEPVFLAYAEYQRETLDYSKSLWARFDVKNMVIGISIMASSVIALLVYINKRTEDDDVLVIEDSELDHAEKSLELQGITADEGQSLEKRLFRAAMLGALPGVFGGLLQSYLSGNGDWYRGSAVGALTSAATVLVALYDAEGPSFNVLPTTLWGWMAVVFTISQSIGFASNSYTIWEDSIQLFMMTTFGLVTAFSAFRMESLPDRFMTIYHSVLFVLLGRLASFSKLCREEQMPYCTSTYYASATSSTSAPWQLAIPFIAAIILPSIIKAYLAPSKSYEGLAPTWIGYVFRAGLFFSAIYWVLDAADNGNWLSSLSSLSSYLPSSASDTLSSLPPLPDKALKTLSVYTAQMILSLALVAGSTAFVWAPPCISIITSALRTPKTAADPLAAIPGAQTAQVTVLGYGNAHGARYLLLPLNFFVALFLLTKPMGAGALALTLWQSLSLLEILDLLNLPIGSNPIGPVMLALLGQNAFFKTGHQAVLSSIQWDSAFIPLYSIKYPWSPLLVILNTFAGQILATILVPMLVLWKSGPKRRGILGSVSRALGVFVAFYATQALATMMWAGHLRRHLMLYRVFSPRFMTAAVTLLVVDVVAVVVGLTGVRVNMMSVAEVFGWAD
ncbi:hypothetical protein GE21DRAFT_4137 [Neurospora crassa]|uniref:Glycosylphophatidylinositol anchor phosphoethanolamine transferase 3 n=1 Tax=Neurospora crassa (strain ATCC 24698 / 74-OR23-1A / CBS 708.71 / DSM 1257 / FGSC 987) TaxID=367110 RepID=Q7RYG7_NEUCR|nr:glycosylphophatidylinositol anchor phosphoethanolamine transferase 3 [Neurospora crassa OR74A]EAA27912.1 glycosylphophatidylinositol anchor phosphoethanolamine transferase 3 [Neurospora crassa OR74A]KHE85511.1 hypothetical protein GE21DRAFT_4137 [Neurospora crassa]|eukprot:XP_957148.1 glycosylphophatidylinositol anchor phosphoethanolamine transferase 3 [Neurospora crassa OR74A]